MKYVFFLLAPFVLFSSCLQTRNDMKEAEQKQVLQKQVVDLQKTNADSSSRFSELDEQMRFLTGRVEVVENKLHVEDQNSAKSSKNQVETVNELKQKVTLIQEELVKIEAQMAQLSSELAALRADQSAQVARETVKAAVAEKKDAYQTAQDLFKQKEWQKAVIEYSKYRDKNPQGKHYADATYKIGVCFQELGMKDDAKTFFQEVATRFPNSEDARRAKSRLKSLK